MRIMPAQNGREIAEICALFREYEQAIGVDLGSRGFHEELATLPSKYAGPNGVLMLARDTDRQALGCVAVRPLDGLCACELKRLYVRPAGRRRGFGRALLTAAIAFARDAG